MRQGALSDSVRLRKQGRFRLLIESQPGTSRRTNYRANTIEDVRASVTSIFAIQEEISAVVLVLVVEVLARLVRMVPLIDGHRGRRCLRRLGGRRAGVHVRARGGGVEGEAQAVPYPRSAWDKVTRDMSRTRHTLDGPVATLEVALALGRHDGGRVVLEYGRGKNALPLSVHYL